MSNVTDFVNSTNTSSVGTPFSGNGNISHNDVAFARNPNMIIMVLARIHFVANPMIAVLGIIGNLLAFFTFVSKSLRRTSCSLYLAARSLSDSAFLLSLFLTWLGDAAKFRLYHIEAVCKMITFLTYVCGFLSVWLVVFVTIENYIRIGHPFSVSRFCTVRTAVTFIIVFTVAGIVMFHFPFWIMGLIKDKRGTYCNVLPKYEDILHKLSYVDTTISLIIPSVVIIVLMVAITWNLIKSLRRQNRLKQPNQRSNNSRQSGKKKNASPQAKVTRMLFAVSFIFLALNFPSYIVRLRIMILTLEKQASSSPDTDQMLQVIFQMFYYLSFAVNLAVYLICGENFRKVFCEKYISCFMRSNGLRRKSDVSHTSFTAVRVEVPEQVVREEETSLIT